MLRSVENVEFFLYISWIWPKKLNILNRAQHFEMLSVFLCFYSKNSKLNSSTEVLGDFSQGMYVWAMLMPRVTKLAQ